VLALTGDSLSVRSPRWLCAALLWVGIAGCATPPVRLREPDATRSLALGSEGPFGVELHVRDVRVRLDEVIAVDVLVPLEMDGTPRSGSPVVLLVQGAFVGRERYRWLGVHLASRGFAVLAPGHLLDLAFFEQGNALAALGTLRAATDREGDALYGVLADGPIAIVGHSLGGVVAATAWGQSPELVTHLVLLASYPQEGSFAPRAAGRVLSLLGTEDGRTSRAQAGAGAIALRTSEAPVTTCSSPTE